MLTNMTAQNGTQTTAQASGTVKLPQEGQVNSRSSDSDHYCRNGINREQDRDCSRFSFRANWRTCAARTSFAVKSEWSACAAASTAGRPLASSRSTRQATAITFIPASRAASIAVMVDAPWETSSTIKTGRLFRKSLQSAVQYHALFSFADQKSMNQRAPW